MAVVAIVELRPVHLAQYLGRALKLLQDDVLLHQPLIADRL